MELAEHSQAVADLSANMVYISGASFVAGSAVTLLILLILDFTRRNVEKRGDSERPKGEKFR